MFSRSIQSVKKCECAHTRVSRGNSCEDQRPRNESDNYTLLLDVSFDVTPATSMMMMMMMTRVRSLAKVASVKSASGFTGCLAPR